MTRTHTPSDPPFVDTHRRGPARHGRPAPAPPTADRARVVGPIRRRKIDTVLVAVGGLVTLVLLVAGGLLTWGNRFAADYVGDELSSQNIVFPDAAALEEEGRDRPPRLRRPAGHHRLTRPRPTPATSAATSRRPPTAPPTPTSASRSGPPGPTVQAATDDGAPQATIDELQAEVDDDHRPA